ncbi:uncharacterized protein LOC141908414 [Tubulanus polymorphus]|uniref:uncharacterized protein LOC141908414 n=1 Tax=Tubulanus polymorphus TaxID=672921 RepID=UPI003DA6C77E
MTDTNQERPLVFRLNDGGGPDLVRQVFLERGWVEYDEQTSQNENEWNIWWKTARFRISDSENIKPWQRLNHYPKTTALTKKDTLARNLKRMKGIYGASVYNFSPIAYNLPNEYTKFVADYTKLRHKEPKKKSYWICKPADLSRGRGIFIFNDLSQLQYDCNAVVQKYISNPLLISGYKFDLRLYVCVPSFHPLYAYICQEGIARFSTEKFDLENLDNVFSHLTNTSINKFSPSYTAEKRCIGAGCKWTLTQLRHYFHQNDIDDRLLWTRVISVVILTLIVQAPQVPKVDNCFELYGFDIIIDENMKPWLLEVNFSPALSEDCQTDILVKKPMLHDLMQMLNFKDSDVDCGKSSEKPKNSDVVDKKASKSKQTLNRDRLKNSVQVLPHIVGDRNQQSKSYVCEDSDSTDSDPDNPIKPGCGLPSVQLQRKQRRYTVSSSSGCSSASSSNRRLQTPARKNSRASNEDAVDFRDCENVLKGKENSKTSLLSADSAVSCQSGTSSDVSDLYSIEESKSQIEISNRNADDEAKDRSSNDCFDESSSRSSSSFNLLSRYAKLRPQLDLDAEIKKSLERYHKAGGQPLISLEKLQKQKSLSPVRKNTKMMRWSTRPQILVSGSQTDRATTRRRSCISLDSPLVERKRVPNSTPRDLQAKTSKSSAIANIFTAAIKPPTKQRGPQSRFGDFFLVFPFNDVTRKVAGNLDARVVSREIQRLTRACSNEVRGGDSSPRAGAPAMERFTNVWDLPLIWGPVRSTST